MTDSFLLASSFLGAFSETFVYRHVVGMKSLRPVVLVRQRQNPDLFPAPGIPVYTYPEGMTFSERVWRKVMYPGNPWAPSRRRTNLAAEICREHGVKAILAHYGDIAISITPLARKLRLPLVAHFHGHDASKLMKKREYLVALNNCWPHFSAVVTPSAFIGQKVIEAGCPESKLRVIHLGVPVPPPRPQPHSGKGLQFIHVGRLVEKKGLKFSIEAFARALPRIPDSTFTIVGRGDRQKEYEDLAVQLGVEKQIVFMGPQPNEKVLKLLREADVFIQHSVTASDGDTEGLPISILEAQANSVPVVSTRHAGIPEEVIDGETGFLVEERDIDAMADRIARLGSDRLLRMRMSDRAREHAVLKFDLEKQNAAIEQLLIGLIEERKSAES